MDAFATSFCAGLGASLTQNMLNGLARQVRRSFQAPEKEEAFGRCVRDATEALLQQACIEAKPEQDHLATIFGTFFRDEEVADALGVVLNGETPDPAFLRKRFADLGGDAETLSDLGIDFDRGIAAFSMAFAESVKQEETFQGTIQTDQLLKQTRELVKQTGLSEKMLAAVQELVRQGWDNRFRSIEEHAPSPDADRENKAVREAREQYLSRLRRFCKQLLFDPLGGDHQLFLDDVYIDLNTRTPRKKKGRKRKGDQELFLQEDTELVPMLDAFLAHDHLVVLGDPGSGKSSFAKRVMGRHADWLSGENAEPIPGLSETTVPVWIELRHLIPALNLRSEVPFSCAVQEAVLGEVKEYLTTQLTNCEESAFVPRLLNALMHQDCFIVFDGLDEVPESERLFARQVVDTIVSNWQPKRVLLTCRIRSYVGDYQLSGVHQETLAPLNRDQIDRFCHGWYDALAKVGIVSANQDGTRRGDSLTTAALGNDLVELAENPVLLTTMAVVHQKDTELPKQRVVLYRRAVDILARRWQLQTGAFGRKPSKALKTFLSDERLVLEALQCFAYELHAASERDTATTSSTRHKQTRGELSRGNAITCLETGGIFEAIAKGHDLLPVALIGEFLDYVDQRTGLVHGLGNGAGGASMYAFPHRTFQEYLAGCYLVSQPAAASVIREKAASGDYWHLAVKLGLEDLFFNNPSAGNQFFDLAQALAPRRAAQEPAHMRQSLWAAHMLATAGPAAIRKYLKDEAEEFAAEQQERLQTLVEGGSLSAHDRVEAGQLLGRLEDPRFRKDVFCLPADELGGFQPVLAGPFLMGSDKGESGSSNNEVPRHSVDLDYDYWIGRYPVTNAQFACFVQAGGYDWEEFWTEARDAGVWTPEGVKGWGDEKPRKSTDSPPFPFNLPNHPAVSVTWYEMLAYCRWLDRELRSSQDVPESLRDLMLERNLHVSLPSEAEWEKAARGVKGQRYPWPGDEVDPEKVNYVETDIGSTSAVGCFPGGVSPYGCLDMAGNVWEWTRSLWKNYPYTPSDKSREDLTVEKDVSRVLRGGAFGYPYGLVRCACRSGTIPFYRPGSIGFRIVLSPSNSGI